MTPVHSPFIKEMAELAARPHIENHLKSGICPGCISRITLSARLSNHEIGIMCELITAAIAQRNRFPHFMQWDEFDVALKKLEQRRI